MPDKLVRCFKKVKQDLKEDHSKWSPKRVDRVARAICVKQTGQQFKHSDSNLHNMFDVSFNESGKAKSITFSFETPFQFVERGQIKDVRPEYQLRDPDSKIVVGRAIFGSSSANFNEYEEAELKKATKTILGIPCQVDHSISARDTFGLVTDGWWDKTSSPQELAYIAELEGSDPITAKVEKGYLRGVSVAGGAKEIKCSICNEDWDWMHEHMPGQTYEGKVCKRRFKGIYFEHLGFTPFPAIEGADANYVAANMSEAVENAMAYAEYRAKVMQDDCEDCDDDSSKIVRKVAASSSNTGGNTDFIETISMSSELEKEYLIKIEKEKLRTAEVAKEKANLEAQVADMDKIQEALNVMQAKEKERLISEVIDLQLQLKKLDQSKVSERRADLAKESVGVLEAKVSVLKEFDVPITEQTPPAGSRSVNFNKGSKFHELDEAKKQTYIKEAKLEQLSLGLFQKLPSVSAVQTLKEWDSSMNRWRTDLSDLFKAAPKGVQR